MVAFVGVYRSLSTGRAAAWARLGFYGFIVGTVFWLAHTGIELGYSAVAEEWSNATETDKETRLLIASGLRDVDQGLIPVAAISHWAALLSLGIGMASGTVYPKRFGRVFILLGALVVAFTILGTLTGNDDLLFPVLILAALTYLWMLVPGIWISRKAW